MLRKAFKNYSIIVPHYQDPRIESFIKSVPKNRSDIEVIVIDDCSDSFDANALMKCFRESYDIRVFRTAHNKGAGAARNVGLAHAVGSWILFADSDDEFSGGAFDFFDSFLEDSSDIIFFPPEAFRRDGKHSERARKYQDLCFNYSLGESSSDIDIRVNFVVPWSKMFKRDFIDQKVLSFDEIRYANDVMFSVQAGLLADSIKVSRDCVYRVCESSGSLTSSRSVDIFSSRFNVILRKNSFLREYGLGFKQEYVFLQLIQSGFYGVHCFLITLRAQSGSGSPLFTADLFKDLLFKVGVEKIYVKAKRIRSLTRW